MESRPNHKIAEILIYASWLFILFVAVYDLFITPYKSILWFSLLAILVFAYRKFSYVSVYIHLLFAAFWIPNILGEELFKFFYITTYYDKILHLVNPIIISSFVYHIVKHKIEDKRILIMLCVFSALSFGILWEIIEYGFDNIFGSVMQGVYLLGGNEEFFGIVSRQAQDKFTDTMQDMTYETLGVFIFAVGYYLWYRIKSSSRQDYRVNFNKNIKK